VAKPTVIIEAIGREPSPEIVLMMLEPVEQLYCHVGVGQLKDLAVAKLEGYSNAKISERFECSERTIERRLRLILQKLQQELISDHDNSQKKTADRGTRAD
jgi:DNA-directed RNA polymerase specialized sigma24 family protein